MTKEKHEGETEEENEVKQGDVVVTRKIAQSINRCVAESYGGDYDGYVWPWDDIESAANVIRKVLKYYG